MSSAPSFAPAVNGFRHESFSPDSALDPQVRDRLAPLLHDSAGGLDRLAITSREPGFSLVTVSADDSVVGYAAATLASDAAPGSDLPPVTVGGFTAEAATAWAAARGRGDAVPESLVDEVHDALRLDPFVIDPDLDTITVDHVARGLVQALLDGRDGVESVRRVLVRPASPAVAVLLRAGWRAIKMDPLSPWAQFEAPE